MKTDDSTSDTSGHPSKVSWFLRAEYSMLIVLALLCAAISASTVRVLHTEGADAGEEVADKVIAGDPRPDSVLVVASEGHSGSTFAESLTGRLSQAGVPVSEIVRGQATDVRREIERQAAEGSPVTVVACDHRVAEWDMWNASPLSEEVRLVSPDSYRWPVFLTPSNLINVADGVTVIAIIAIGMTMVIITAGIDLSVGSLIALSAVLAALVVQNLGGEDAGTGTVLLGFAVAVAACGGVGLFNGTAVTAFGIPPFIVTLATMSIASGLAFIVSAGKSINELPDSFEWLGTGTLGGIPNTVLLMLALYVAAHFLMTATPLGRHIYAVGGNREAARLSGVPVKRVLLFVYGSVGVLAGLAGVLTASRLGSAAPRYGQMLELEVIAAVVVGGTSLAGGEGRIFGTLVGAFIIAVINNAMNLLNVESYTQKVVLGVVILGAVLLDQAKKKASARMRTA